jgi:hypothetical protein
MTTRGSHREGEDLDRIVSELTAVRELLARGSTGGGLAATIVEALGQPLARSDTMVCLLEQIACHTCETWNEIHIQTDLQTDSREAVSTLVEQVKSAYPNAALELERLRVLTARVDDCCPSAHPEPVCTLELCPPKPEHGDAELQHGSAAPNRVEGAPYPPFEITGEAAEGRNIDVLPRIPEGPLRGPLARVLPALHIRDIADGAGAGAGAGANPVVFVTDTPAGLKVSFSGFPPDMSGASGNGVVLMSGNTWAACSIPTPGPPSRRWTRPRYSRPSPPRTPRATSWTTACAVTKSSGTCRRSTGSSG